MLSNCKLFRSNLEDTWGNSSSDDEEDNESCAKSQRPDQQEDYFDQLIPPVQNAIPNAMGEVHVLWECLDAAFNYKIGLNDQHAYERVTSDIEARTMFFHNMTGIVENYTNLTREAENANAANERDARFLQLINDEYQRAWSLLQQELSTNGDISTAG